MTYAMMKKTTKLMPLMRHKRSQNTLVVNTLVDEVLAMVDALMRISSRTKGEFGSPAALVAGHCGNHDVGDVLICSRLSRRLICAHGVSSTLSVATSSFIAFFVVPVFD